MTTREAFDMDFKTMDSISTALGDVGDGAAIPKEIALRKKNAAAENMGDRNFMEPFLAGRIPEVCPSQRNAHAILSEASP